MTHDPLGTYFSKQPDAEAVEVPQALHDRILEVCNTPRPHHVIRHGPKIALAVAALVVIGFWFRPVSEVSTQPPAEVLATVDALTRPEAPIMVMTLAQPYHHEVAALKNDVERAGQFLRQATPRAFFPSQRL